MLEEDKGREKVQICCNWIEKAAGEERAIMKRQGGGGSNHSAQPEWPGLLPSNLVGSSSNPPQKYCGGISFLNWLSEGSLLLYP